MLDKGKDDYIEQTGVYWCKDTVYLPQGFAIKEFQKKGDFSTFFYYLYDPKGEIILTDYSYKRVIQYFNEIITNPTLYKEILEGERKWK